MQFSAMTMNMFVPSNDDPKDDERIIDMTVAQTIWLAELGFNPWFTDHHFKGPYNSNPMQFAAHVAPLIPKDRYMGFGVLSIPFYHPLRLVESMNLLDHLAKGRVLFGVGSGWQGTEPAGLGIPPEYHASGRMAEDMLTVMERMWSFKYGDPEYSFEVGDYKGKMKRRVMPAPYSAPYPTLIRTATREPALVRAAQKGWPAFLGIFGSDLHGQIKLYRETLMAANHPKHVVENCLRWCTFDWLSVTVAETDEKAKEIEKLGQAEQIAIRTDWIKRHGPLDGPVMKPVVGKSTADDYAKGGDQKGSISGSPDTIAKKVQALVDAGINHLHLRFNGEWAGETRHIAENSAKLFAKEVAPRFANVKADRELVPGE
jgi:alkanesulfonate monooxygenase SsuD/methylene tetrahydromethanopterin reductase-like flavin-dependent oxidoreductase (luciferase family)